MATTATKALETEATLQIRRMIEAGQPAYGSFGWIGDYDVTAFAHVREDGSVHVLIEADSIGDERLKLTQDFPDLDAALRAVAVWHTLFCGMGVVREDDRR